MSRLLRLITAAFGDEVRADRLQFPASVFACKLPRERFAAAASVLKNAHALLVAEWATD